MPVATAFFNLFKHRLNGSLGGPHAQAFNLFRLNSGLNSNLRPDANCLNNRH
jgi:hypothetical protein